MKTYNKDFLPRGWPIGYCSLVVMLGVLNYFFGTNFAAKDNFDVFGLVKWGRREQGDLISMSEMALFLERLYLQPTIYSSMSKESADSYAAGDKEEKLAIIKSNIRKEYHHCIQGDQWVLESGQKIDLIDELVEQRLEESSVNFSYGIEADDIPTLIKQHQLLEKGGVLFIIGLNYNILYDEPAGEDNGGHMIISEGIEDGKFIIHEPIYPRPNPHYIDKEKVLTAMQDMGSVSLLMVKDNPEHWSS